MTDLDPPRSPPGHGAYLVARAVYDDVYDGARDRLLLALDGVRTGRPPDLLAADLRALAGLLAGVDTRVARSVALLDTPTLGAIRRAAA